MQTIKEITELRKFLRNERLNGKTIGFVPTMGALHEGHLALARRCQSENDVTVVSIFVNPTQFNDPADLKNYPVILREDTIKLVSTGVDYLFLPEYETIYPDKFTFYIDETDLSKELCGISRTGHFRGVLTVVMKLLNIVGADRAYFGEKDYQQYRLINGMIEAFFMETAIIPVPTVREESGLALSSRNSLLDEDSRKRAPLFFGILSSSESCSEARMRLQENGFFVDYVTDIGNRRFGAVILGGIRLIDNVQI
jgi:pantoate--beta-alanine ligase